MLERKSATVERYRARLEEMRREHEAERAADRARAQEQAERMFADNAATLQQLRQALAEAEAGRGTEELGAGVREGLIERLAQAEDASMLKQRMLQELEAEVRAGARAVCAVCVCERVRARA